MDYSKLLPDTADIPAIQLAHDEKQRWVNQDKKGFLRYRTPCNQLSQFKAEHLDLDQDKVIIGKADEISREDQQQIQEYLKQFMPWRKGPFSIFDIDIDAEWRSEKKWQRTFPELPNLQGKNIADIGCNNGYYMFRMAPQKPNFVLGLEPSVQHYYCFKALNGMAQQPNLHIDLLGVEHLPLFKECFDVIFLMGIIYHRSSPIDVLRDTFESLRPGGTLIVESQAIPGEESYALFPEKTYAKVPGTYFVPTGKCLENWMNRAGFTDTVLASSVPMSSAEQRKTEWMIFESYEDFIDQKDNQLTVEGYPAPLRVILSGHKK